MKKIIKHFGDKTLEYSEVLEKGICYYDGQDTSCPYIFMEQIHTDNVVIITEKPNTNIIPQCDGLITNIPNICLCVKTADCFPVLIYDESKGVVSAIHSGRESTRLKIVGKAVQIMINDYHSDPKDIKVEIGPGISYKNYEVTPDIAQEFHKTFPPFHYEKTTCNTDLAPLPKGGRGDSSVISQDNKSFICLDLKSAIIQTALENGILKENISASDICTYENENFYSYRRGDLVKRQISWIAGGL